VGRFSLEPGAIAASVCFKLARIRDFSPSGVLDLRIPGGYLSVAGCHAPWRREVHFCEEMRRGRATMIGKKIDEIRLGDKAEFAKTISESDVYLYAGVTGDLNPAHVNEEYAKKTFFKTRIVHGMLSAGFISTIFGTKFPGPGTIYLRQVIEFVAPVYIGDTITASVEVVDINVEKNRVIFKTICVNQESKEVLTGEAVVSPPKPLKK
jgi:3-hydroxybutyryl-CoA dehydratase